MQKIILILADKFSVAYDEIDKKHKKLVEMIKRHFAINDLKPTSYNGK